MINRRLLDLYNAGIERSMDDYWRRTSPVAEHDRRIALAERKRKDKARQRAKEKEQA